MPKTTPNERNLSSADRLERQLNRLLAAQRKQLKNENIVRLEPNGEISFESIRTVAIPAPVGQAASLSIESPSAAHEVEATPNNFPETPDSSKNGKEFDTETANQAAEGIVDETPQNQATVARQPSGQTHRQPHDDRISFHDAVTSKEIAASESDADPLEAPRPRLAVPAAVARAFDGATKGSCRPPLPGMSLRQPPPFSASRTPIRLLQADTTLAEEITAARFSSASPWPASSVKPAAPGKPPPGSSSTSTQKSPPTKKPPTNAAPASSANPTNSSPAPRPASKRSRLPRSGAR
jgi:hypothetical protein